MEMCKTLLGFAHFHRHGGDELKTTKPDRSLATKTGHFYLLPTEQHTKNERMGCVFSQCRRADSNRGPKDYESLFWRIAINVHGGISQYSCGFEPVRVRCGYASLDGDWAHKWAQEIPAPHAGMALWPGRFGYLYTAPRVAAEIPVTRFCLRPTFPLSLSRPFRLFIILD